jgi:hypothetical protein
MSCSHQRQRPDPGLLLIGNILHNMSITPTIPKAMPRTLIARIRLERADGNVSRPAADMFRPMSPRGEGSARSTDRAVLAAIDDPLLPVRPPNGGELERIRTCLRSERN